MTRFAVSAVAAAVAACSAQAQSPLQYAPPTAPPPIDPVGVLVRLVGLTVLTLAVCGGVIWWARRAQRAGPKMTGASDRLTAAGQLALDPRCTLHLLRVDGRPVVVTTGPTGVRAIVPLREQFEQVLADEAVPEEAVPPGPPPAVTS